MLPNVQHATHLAIVRALRAKAQNQRNCFVFTRAPEGGEFPGCGPLIYQRRQLLRACKSLFATELNPVDNKVLTDKSAREHTDTEQTGSVQVLVTRGRLEPSGNYTGRSR